MGKIRKRKVENGIIVSLGKKEFFCRDEAEGKATARALYMDEIAPALADRAVDDLFPPEIQPQDIVGVALGDC
jgi:hypothetical protein